MNPRYRGENRQAEGRTPADGRRAFAAPILCSQPFAAGGTERARIILDSANGEQNKDIAARLKLSMATVGKWRLRFLVRRIAGLYDDMRPGKPRTIDDERVAQLINTAATYPAVRS